MAVFPRKQILVKWEANPIHKHTPGYFLDSKALLDQHKVKQNLKNLLSELELGLSIWFQAISFLLQHP